LITGGSTIVAIAHQLDLDLWQQLADAHRSPQAANWLQLCLSFDTMIDQLPVEERLAIAAAAITEMTDLLTARAEAFFSTWHQHSRSEQEPILAEAWLGEFVRQSMHLDLTGLVAEPQLYERSSSSEGQSERDSIIHYPTKEAVLAELESVLLEPTVEQVESIAHNENVADWIAAIAQCLSSRSEAMSLPDLQTATQLSIIEVWLGLLLMTDSRILQQTGDFYNSATLLIKRAVT
jgi:hypothetical protein